MRKYGHPLILGGKFVAGTLSLDPAFGLKEANSQHDRFSEPPRVPHSARS